MKHLTKKLKIRVLLGILILLMFFSLTTVTVISPENRYMLYFNGTSDYVEIPDSASLNCTSVTVETWFYRTGDGGENPVVAGKGSNYYLYHQPDKESSTRDDQLLFYIRNESYPAPGSTHWVAEKWVASLNTWVHAVGTYDSSISEMRLYVNGLEVTPDLAARNATGNIRLSNESFYIGRWVGDTPWENWHEGYIDEVRVYNRVITSTEVSYSYNNGRGRDTPLNHTGLVGWYRFNEGSGTDVFDETSNNNDGTINGCVWVGGGVVFPSQISNNITTSATTIISLYTISFIFSIAFIIKSGGLKSFKEVFATAIAMILLLAVLMGFLLFFNMF